MTKILISDSIHPEFIDTLEEIGIQVDYKPNVKDEHLFEIIPEYDGLVVRSRTKVTQELIEQGSKLKVIGRAGVGLDNIDVDYANEKEIIVVNTPEAPSASVAELVIGLMISIVRYIPLANASMKEGIWIKSKLTGYELKDKTLGIIGLGRVGSIVARIASAIGMSILFFDPYVSVEYAEKLGFNSVSLETLLNYADVVTLHVPLTSETYHMISRSELNVMKKSAILINTSRGAVIDESALVEALRSGEISGAGLDVYSNEPPKDMELINLPNVICTPHIGSETLETKKRIATLLAEKVIKILYK
jgi:D-3-phosphoglycerate dehydrogenase